MAFTFIQSAADAGAEPRTATWDVAVTSGNLLIAACYWNSTTATATVTDTANGNWTAIGSPTAGSEALANWRRQMFWVESAVTGDTTVDFSITGSPTGLGSGIAIHEYSYGDTPSIDGTPVYDNANNTDTPTTSAIVTTVNADLLFAMCVAEVSVTSAGTGYILRESASFASNGTEDDTDGGTAGSKTASFNVSSGDNMLGFVAFKEGAAAVPIPAYLPGRRVPKRLAGPAQLSNVAATKYTTPDGYRAMIRSVHVSNPTGAAVDFTLSIGTDAAGTRLYDGYPIPSDSYKRWFLQEWLEPGEIIQAFASTGSALVLTIDGFERPAG